jgi:hypothetical protein
MWALSSFFIGASTSELDLFLITEGFEVVVNELRAESIPKSLKGRALFDLLHRVKHSCLAFAHNGASFHPGCVNVGDIE